MGRVRSTAVVLTALAENTCSIQELTKLVGNVSSVRSALHRLRRWGWQIVMCQYSAGICAYYIIDSEQRKAAGNLSKADLDRKMILPPRKEGR